MTIRDRAGRGADGPLLIHQAFGEYDSAWRAMERIHAEKLSRAIGVSNFHPERLIDLIATTRSRPAVNQIETHPFFQRAELTSS